MEPVTPETTTVTAIIPRETRRLAGIRAAEAGLSLRGWLRRLVEEAVEKPTPPLKERNQ